MALDAAAHQNATMYISSYAFKTTHLRSPFFESLTRQGVG